MYKTPLVILVSLITCATNAADWPQWLGPQGKSVFQEEGVLTSIPSQGLKTRWEFEVGMGYSGPSVAKGRVYLMDYISATGDVTNNAGGRDQLTGTERVLCLDAKTGKLIWKFEYDRSYDISYSGGPRCTPTVADGKVYALGAEGNLNCLDADSGKLIWAKDFHEDYAADTPFWGHSAHPFVHTDTLYCIVGGEGSVAVAFDKDTGEERWRALSAATQGYCSPSMIRHGGKDLLIIWHPESVNALNPETGEVYWSEALKPDYGGSIQVPRKLGSLLFVGGPRVASLFKLNNREAKPGVEVVWHGNPRNAVYPVNSTIIFNEEAIYSVDNGTSALTAVDPADGRRIWETKEPVLIDKITRTRQGTAFMVRLRDTPVYYILNENGDFIISEITPGGYLELGRFHVIDPTTKTNAAGSRMVVWSHPAFSEKTLFARNDKKLLAIDLNTSNYAN